jgi:hypothetical protein
VQHAQVHQPDVARNAGHLHDLQQHVADSPRPVKQVRAMLRTVGRSVRTQQVGEEWLGAQESSELRGSDRSTLIQQVMRARDGKGAAEYVK